MTSGLTLIIGIIIVLVLIITFLVFKDAILRRRVKKLINGSSGVFDNAAKSALKTLSYISTPTVKDLIDRADVIRFNMLENMQKRDIPAAVYRQAVNAIVTDYTAALQELPATQDAIPVIDHIREFRNVVRDDVLTNDDEYIEQMLGFFMHETQNINKLEDKTAKQVANDVKQTATSGKDAAEKLFDGATAYTSQPQNVHDSAVNSDLNETLQKLLPCNVPPATSIHQAREFINANTMRPEKPLKILDIISADHYISTFNTTEGNIFSAVWQRANHPNNKENSDNIRAAIVEALSDSDEGGPVCINGRCARLLGSLVTLDYDPSMGSAMTFEAYKNMIYQETKDIIESELDAAKKSGNNDLKESAELYDAMDDEDPEKCLLFRNILRQRIDENLNNYTSKIRPTDLALIRTQCYVYALLE